MGGGGLRSRLFRAIGVVVLICVAFTIGIGLVLTRRAVEQATLRDLAHQVELIHAFQGIHGPNSLPPLPRGQQERLATHPRILPDSARRQLGDGVQGKLTHKRTAYYFAARHYRSGTLILLRPQSAAGSLLSPYVWGLLVAAVAGGLLAAAAAFLLARRIARPVDRVSAAARSLTRGTHPDPVPVEGAAEIATLAAAFNELAAQLRQAQEAERNFLLSVSHELKTPLTAIRGYSEAVEDGAVDAREAAATVASEARRLERLVRDLLDLARMHRSAFSIRGEPVDLAEVAREVVRRHEVSAREFGVALAAEGFETWVEADHDRVLQVASNLTENALRETPSGGSVTLRVEQGLLEVSDTGPGIPPDDVPRAFERFYLYDKIGKDRPVGSGLGLAIVKQLVTAMGGSVDVRSSSAGTTFEVRLRMQPAGVDDLEVGTVQPAERV